MGTKNQGALLAAMHNFAEFTRRMGSVKHAERIEKRHARLKEEKLDAKQLKSLKEDVFSARGLASFYVPRLISNRPDEPAVKQQLTDEFFRLRSELEEALYPTKPKKFTETEVTGFLGGRHSTMVMGNPATSEEIGRRALDVVHRFCTAVFSQDLETAYGLCANELRGWMGVKRFYADLQKADKQYGGKPVRYVFESIGRIYADEAARNEGNSAGGWPKDTPKQNKRATVVTYWHAESEQGGRNAAFMVTEEAEGYRIAKFSQYTQ